MMKKIGIGIVFFMALGLLFFLFFSTFQKLPNGKHVTMAFLSVTRGDAIYLQTPHGKEILWDGGDDLSVLQELSQQRVFWDRHIDLWIISHPDSDHYYGGIEVLKRFEIDTILLTGVVKNDPKYHQLFEIAEKKGSQIIIADHMTDIVIDGVVIDTIFPSFVYGSRSAADNNFSLVQKVMANDKTILMTGDIEKESEEKLVSSGIDLAADILKVPHHGSKSSSSEFFIQSVSPDLAIFTVGTKNRFGHPHDEVLDRYKKMGISYRNTQNGSVVLRW